MTWRLSAVAVRSWQRLMDVPDEDLAIARRQAEEAVEQVRQRYVRAPGLRSEERRGNQGLYVYRGGGPLRLRVLVDMISHEVVDILGLDGRAAAIENRRRALAGLPTSTAKPTLNPPAMPAAEPLAGGLNAKQRRALRRATKLSGDE